MLVFARFLKANDGLDTSRCESGGYAVLRIKSSAWPLHGKAVITHPAAVHTLKCVGTIFLQQPVFVAAAAAALKRADDALPSSTAHANRTHQPPPNRSQNSARQTIRTTICVKEDFLERFFPRAFAHLVRMLLQPLAIVTARRASAPSNLF
jgi:hypothetical protein